MKKTGDGVVGALLRMILFLSFGWACKHIMWGLFSLHFFVSGHLSFTLAGKIGTFSNKGAEGCTYSIRSFKAGKETG